MRGEENGLTHTLRRSLHTWQEVAIVHQEVETVEAAKDEITLQIWPTKGAIQIDEGVLTEQQLFRQEANISMYVLVACRLLLCAGQPPSSELGSGLASPALPAMSLIRCTPPPMTQHTTAPAGTARRLHRRLH